jgi:hypothetical protein
MSAVVVVIGIFITAMGLLGIAAPGRLIHFVKSVQTPAGLYSAAGLRVLLGVALWFAAPASRAPDALRILGVVVLVAGLVTPIFGLKRSHKLLEWWWSRGAGFIRAWAFFAAAFGLLLIYSVTP